MGKSRGCAKGGGVGNWGPPRTISLDQNLHQQPCRPLQARQNRHEGKAVAGVDSGSADPPHTAFFSTKATIRCGERG